MWILCVSWEDANELKARIDSWFEQAEAEDEAEDAEFGTARRNECNVSP